MTLSLLHSMHAFVALEFKEFKDHHLLFNCKFVLGMGFFSRRFNHLIDIMVNHRGSRHTTSMGKLIKITYIHSFFNLSKYV